MDADRRGAPRCSGSLLQSATTAFSLRGPHTVIELLNSTCYRFLSRISSHSLNGKQCCLSFGHRLQSGEA